MSELKKIVDERMEGQRAEILSDYREATKSLPSEKRRNMQALESAYVAIQAEKRERRLAALGELLESLDDRAADLTALISKIIATAQSVGRNSAYEEIAQRLDRWGYRMYGNRWIENMVKDIVSEHYGDMPKGNGQ